MPICDLSSLITSVHANNSELLPQSDSIPTECTSPRTYQHYSLSVHEFSLEPPVLSLGQLLLHPSAAIQHPQTGLRECAVTANVQPFAPWEVTGGLYHITTVITSTLSRLFSRTDAGHVFGLLDSPVFAAPQTNILPLGSNCVTARKHIPRRE